MYDALEDIRRPKKGPEIGISGPSELNERLILPLLFD
jgi:hypothetical protein